MSKILSIDNDIITIGMDGGTLKEVRAVDLNFVPHVNDEVEIFETETKTIVSKLEKEQPNPLPYSPNGININVQNTQEMKNEQSSTLANGTIAVNKVVYCLLAFFLGAVGGHKFYSHRIGAGVCYLLFCWTGIPAIIALIVFSADFIHFSFDKQNLICYNKADSKMSAFVYTPSCIKTGLLCVDRISCRG